MRNIKSVVALSLLTLVATGAATAAAPGVLPGIEAYESGKTLPSAPSHLTFTPDGEFYYLLSPDKKSVVKYESATGKEAGTVLDVTHTREHSIAAVENFILSPDGSKMLVYAETKAVYRYSFLAPYYVFEISRNILKPLSTDHPWQRDPLFSPDGRMVAFVADNNIYLKKLDYGTETAVTTDGKEGHVINGVPDWGYDEEFDMTCAMAWAPDNTTLVYLKFNETDVPAYTFPLYEGYCPQNTQYALYPGIFSYKYSVPGEPNAKVTLHSFDIDNRKTKDISFPDASIEYIPRMFFAPNDASCLLVPTLNRDQTRMELFAVNPKSTVVKSMFVEQPGAWVMPETYENLKTLDQSFVIMSPRSGYTHLYEYSYAGALVRSITSGNYDVTDYYGCDAQGNHYYQSTAFGAINRVVSRIDIKNKVTDISATEGVASAEFAPKCNYFVLNEGNASKAPEYSLVNSKLKKLRVLVSNDNVTRMYSSAPKREFIKIPSAASGIDLDAYIIKPVNFDASRKYPVILWQYSGPGASSVLNRWSIGWEQYAAANQGYIVVCVDPRGSGGRGYKFLTTGYRHLGLYETDDQCAAARYLASLPYVDGSHIGIAGWSYGGYETLMAVSAQGTPFASGVAVAPVTSWNYYDAIYTERFMLTPAQNPQGYNESAPVNLTARMNVPLLLMAGTADDNVHFSNTVEYLSRLQSNGKLCNLMIFPNKNHSIVGCNSRDLVYSNMLNHFNATLK